jgi:hypothetical protein
MDDPQVKRIRKIITEDDNVEDDEFFKDMMSQGYTDVYDESGQIEDIPVDKLGDEVVVDRWHILDHGDNQFRKRGKHDR